MKQLLQALSLGQQLENSEKWKKAQNIGNGICSVLFSIVSLLSVLGYNFNIGDETLISYLVAAVVFIINILVTTATSAKVGLNFKK